MAIVKNINSTYTITGGDVVITGNLTVNGAQTAIETTNTIMKDNIIFLNDGETGAGVTLGTAGIAVNRGISPNVAIRWNEANGGTWQTANAIGTYSNVVSSSTGLTHVIEDATPTLSNHLNTAAFGIYSGTGYLQLGGNVQINNTVSVPDAVVSSTVLYTATPASGKSGIYVVNESAVHEELVTKTRAFGFSLIL